MGISDYGLNGGRTYSYSAIAFYSQTTFTSLSIGKSSIPSLDGKMAVQLNVIEQGVAEERSLGTYWTQDLMNISQSSGSFALQIEDNIWNNMGANRMGYDYFTNLYGKCVSGGTPGDGNSGQFYYCYGALVSGMTLPFTVELEMYTGTCTASLCGSSHVGDSYVAFWYRIYHGSTLRSQGWYDLVAFHSQVKGDPHYVVAYRANAFGTDFDAETVLTGAGGGASVVINSVSASMFLSYKPNAGSKNFYYVPHAYSAGSETAEAVYGVVVRQSIVHFHATASHGTDSDVQLW